MTDELTGPVPDGFTLEDGRLTVGLIGGAHAKITLDAQLNTNLEPLQIQLDVQADGDGPAMTWLMPLAMAQALAMAMAQALGETAGLLATVLEAADEDEEA